MYLQVAACVQQIQNELPMARVVYCSATGVSEVGNMAFMSRLVCTFVNLPPVRANEARHRHSAVSQRLSSGNDSVPWLLRTTRSWIWINCHR